VKPNEGGHQFTDSLEKLRKEFSIAQKGLESLSEFNLFKSPEE